MSITIESLKTKRKNELKDIAQDYGLNTKGLRWELENRIREHLIENEEESIADSTSSITPARRPSRKPSTSSSRSKPRKQSAISSSPNGGGRASEEESEVSDVEIKQEVNVNARYRSSPNSTEEASIQRGLPSESVIIGIKKYVLRLREEYSNTRTFVLCIVCLELVVFLYCAIEWNLKIATVPIPSFFKGTKDSYDFYGPDIFVIFEWHRFWRPLLSFLGYLLAIPLGFSYMFNLDPQRNTFSPLAFSVAQCGIFLATVGHLDWVEDVRDFIPENLIYAGSGAGIIFSLYESILTI